MIHDDHHPRHLSKGKIIVEWKKAPANCLAMQEIIWYKLDDIN